MKLRDTKPGGNPATMEEGWYYCIACQRVWSVDTWRRFRWLCPSKGAESHPHVGWSYIAGDGQEAPTPFEGERYRLKIS
jgi:hypothetical protein